MPFDPELLEEYRDYRITTRLSGKGVRIYYPNGNGLMDFADSVENAKVKIDLRLKETS